MNDPDPKANREPLLFWILLWALVCASLSHSSTRPLSYDEYLHIKMGGPVASEGNLLVNNGEAHPPLTGFWVAPLLYLGVGPFTLRLLSLVGALLALVFCSRWLNLSQRRAQSSATVVLLACSSGLFALTLQLRAYTVVCALLFFSLLAAENYRNGGKQKHFWLFCLATNLGLATHLGYSLAALGALLYFGWRLQPTRAKFVKAVLFSSAPGLAFAGWDLSRKWRNPHGHWSMSTRLPYLEPFHFDPSLGTLSEYLHHSWRTMPETWFGAGDMATAILFTLTVVGIAVWANLSRQRGNLEPLGWLVVFCVPLLAGWVAALLNWYPFGPVRQAFFLLVFGSVALTLPFGWVPLRVNKYLPAILLVGGIAVLLGKVENPLYYPLFFAGLGVLLLGIAEAPLRFGALGLLLILALRNPEGAFAKKYYPIAHTEFVDAQKIHSLIWRSATRPRTKVFTPGVLYPLSYYTDGRRLFRGRTMAFGTNLARPPSFDGLGLNPIDLAEPDVISAQIEECRRPHASYDGCVFILWRVWESYPLESLPARYAAVAGVRFTALPHWFLFEVTPTPAVNVSRIASPLPPSVAHF